MLAAAILAAAVAAGSPSGPAPTAYVISLSLHTADGRSIPATLILPTGIDVRLVSVGVLAVPAGARCAADIAPTEFADAFDFTCPAETP